MRLFPWQYQGAQNGPDPNSFIYLVWYSLYYHYSLPFTHTQKTSSFVLPCIMTMFILLLESISSSELHRHLAHTFKHLHHLLMSVIFNTERISFMQLDSTENIWHIICNFTNTRTGHDVVSICKSIHQFVIIWIYIFYFVASKI